MTKCRERLRFGLLDGHDRYQPKIGRILAEDSQDRPIERAIREIVVDIIVLGEEQYRERQLSHHKWRLEERARRIAEAKKRKEEAERAERERVAALEKARVDRLLGEAGSLHQAEQIRAYVCAVEARLNASLADGASQSFALWKAWALAQADRIDPVKSGSYLRGLDLRSPRLPTSPEEPSEKTSCGPCKKHDDV